MAIQANFSFLPSQSPLHSNSFHLVNPKLKFNDGNPERRKFRFLTKSSGEQGEDYLIDAPVSVGDGFSFSGGKFSDGPSRSDEWFKRGKYVEAHPVYGTGEKAKDPIFGLTMAGSSQSSTDFFRAYSYRKVLDVLSKDFHVIAFDWLGFGFSDKPQPKYGFDYTLDEYVSSLESLFNKLGMDKVSIIVQGYFAPVVVKYASNHQEKLKDLILVNPPLTNEHVKLPSTLSIFSNFLLGEIFSQDPLRACDKTLTSCGPYKMKEENMMVYRRPYLTSGSSGFALNALSRTMKKDLKGYVENMRKTLSSDSWKVRTTVCWGQRDRWLNYDGVEEYCKDSKHELLELSSAGHHVQEDCGEELGRIIAQVIRKRGLNISP